MPNIKETYDVIVVGAGHAGCEAALARDLKVLVERGYKVEKVQPVDQFANTVHIENACLLSRKDI